MRTQTRGGQRIPLLVQTLNVLNPLGIPKRIRVRYHESEKLKGGRGGEFRARADVVQPSRTET